MGRVGGGGGGPKRKRGEYYFIIEPVDGPLQEWKISTFSKEEIFTSCSEPWLLLLRWYTYYSDDFVWIL